MQIVIAEDDRLYRRLLEAALTTRGYRVTTYVNGSEAWEYLSRQTEPTVAILDWMMPGMDGLEICRRIREAAMPLPPYVILLTSRTRKEDTIAGLQAGADDYLCKPFDPEELAARLVVGTRFLKLQQDLIDRVAQLEDALARVKQLQGLLPICSYCKKIRDDQNYWSQVESYIAERSEVRFTHGICPDCRSRLMEEQTAGLASK
ncbi:MAG: response regulator transcription factor [Acidobacteriota bacterium]|nr:response regulator transcription factor [Acidobacteriota bacterium]